MCRNRKNGGKMTKRFKTMKSSIVIGVLLVSVFAAIIPTSSAGLILNLSSIVNVDWGNETLKPLVPLGEAASLTLDVTYGVTTGAFLSQAFLTLFLGRQVNIKLEVTEKPDWCTATLKSDTITTAVTSGASTSPTKLTTTLTLRVDESAPAFGAGYVKIKASVPRIGAIDGYSQVFTLEFQPAYLPMINAQLPEGNSKTIGPMDTAVFPITVENMGNARTTVFFKIDNVPEGWIVVVTDDITLDAEKGSTGTAYLTIKPPKGFGYHNDDRSIIVTMTPARAEELGNQGESKTVTVIIESRGFSTPGFESLLFIGALFAVVLILTLKKKK
jgi:hypothetical protein